MSLSTASLQSAALCHSRVEYYHVDYVALQKRIYKLHQEASGQGQEPCWCCNDGLKPRAARRSYALLNKPWDFPQVVLLFVLPLCVCFGSWSHAVNLDPARQGRGCARRGEGRGVRRSQTTFQHCFPTLRALCFFARFPKRTARRAHAGCLTAAAR